MSAEPATDLTSALLVGPAAERRRRPLLATFNELSDDRRARAVLRCVPALLLAVFMAVAFPFTALSLWTGLQTDTPLAYQGLIPAVAFLTAVGQSRRRPSYVWRDWLTEAVVATPFLIAAVVMMYAGPRLGSIYFWLNRNDLLALACFGVAASVVLFGVGAVFRSWFAILYLFLLWPVPYRDLLVGSVDAITSATVISLEWMLQQTNIAAITPIGSAVFQIRGPNGTSVVGVDSPCSGASGIFGFLIVAIPTLYLVSGRLSRKIAWLTAGIILLWLLNLVRIVTLFAVAVRYGTSSDVFEWTHLTLGIALFALAMIVMTLVGWRIGFRFESRPPVTMPSMLRVRATRPAPVAVVCVVIVALFLGHLNSGMVDAVGLSSSLTNDARIDAFAELPPAVHGTSPAFVEEYPWAQQFFGRGSEFRRFVYRQQGGPSIWVDSVVTNDRRRLDLYNVQGCYSFHGYDMRAMNSVDLGHGIAAQQMQFVVSGAENEWVAFTWTWPVVTDQGDQHERLTVFYRVDSASGAGDVIQHQDSARSLVERLVGIGNGRVANGPEAEQLQAFARALISGQVGLGVGGR